MKIYRLLLILLVAACSWGSLRAQCAFQPSISVHYNTYNNNYIDTLYAGLTGSAYGPYHIQWYVNGSLLPDSNYTVTAYLQPGTDVICMTLTDSTGCSASVCDTEYVAFPPCTSTGVSIRDTVLAGRPALLASVVNGHPASTTYEWSTGVYSAATPILSVPAQIYCVTATDHSALCTATWCDTPCFFNAIIIDSIVAGNYIQAQAVGTIGPYQYWWNGTPSTSAYYYAANTAPSFPVTIIDGHSCFFTDTVHPHSCLITDALTYTHDPFNHYTFHANATNGTSPLSYSWTINGYAAAGATGTTLADSLAQGTYVICSSVRDANYCQTTSCDTVVVTAALQCNLSISLYDTLHSGTHFITPALLSTTPGYSGFTFQWSSGSVHNEDSVRAGVHNYCLTITDNFGCTASACYNTCTLAAAATAVASGNGWNQHATVSGAVGTVHYLWSSGDTIANFFTTTRGVYHLTVTDSSGCSVVATDTAGSACYFSGSIAVQSNLGTAIVLEATVYNNHGTVSYLWSNGASNSNILTINTSGPYCVTATDSIGCAATLCDSFVVGCHLAVSITDSFAGNGYTLTAHADSGQAPYTYYWNGTNHPAGGTVIFTPTNGQHCVTVIDHSGCTTTACDSIYVPCTLTVSIVDSSYGSYHILRAVSAGGAWQNYPIYSWTPTGQTGGSPTLIAQTGGTYCVQVTDTNGCTASTCDTVHIGCNLVTSLTYTSTAANLYTFTTSNTGGSGHYAYSWYIDQILHGGSAVYSTTLTPGQHLVWVLVTDSVSNCTDSASVWLTTPPPGCTLSASITQSVTGSVAILTAHAAGAHGPLTYYWPAGSTSAYLTATQSGTYCVTISDSAGCTATACDTLLLNSCGLHASYTYTHTGSIYIFTGTATGAHGAVTYQWRIDGGTPATGSPFTATLAAGVHQICMYARDTAQCRDSLCQSITVTGTGCSIGGYIKDSVVHHTWIGNTHYYVPVAVNGTAPYTYHWSNGSTGPYVYVGFWQSTFNGTVTVTDANGCSAVLHINSAYVDTFCGNVFYDLNGNGVQNTGEAGASGQTVYLYSGSTLVTSVTTDAYGHYAIAVHPGTYTIRYTAGSSYAITIPLNTSTTPNAAQYGPFTISSNANNYCGYNFGIRNTNVTITGYVYLDANNNGIYDAGETPVANQPVHVGPHVVYTNSLGQYTYVGAAGSYAITYVPSSSYSAYTVVPGSHSVNASTPGTTYGGNNFGLQQTSTACNIATTIIPITTITAGYPSWYYVYVSNYGTNVASGTLTFYYDPALTFDYASPVQASVNTTTHTISFIYAGLQPATYTQFYVHFTANTNVAAGQSTFEMATATDNCNESNFYDNTDTLHQIATGSWDPNAKTVTPAGEGAQGLIHRDQELRYTLNFQNTGTAPAVNVVLRDSIPSTLDPSTIRVLGSSHPDYVVQVEGQELVCRYSQIMLPDSFDSEPQSHGFLSFAISPVAGLADATQIQNTASIYFDYNDAVVTNTTLNTIDYTLSVRDVMSGATITVQPNPFSEYTTIRVTGADMHDATLDIYNTLGQAVSSASPSADGVFTVQRGGLSAGIYSYHIRQAGRTIGSGKLVIE